MTWSNDNQFQALALTGGGYRGLFTARALQTMEGHIKEPIGRHFDLITGTSIGGIVALAVAFEIPMSKVVEVFEHHGSDIFPAHSSPKNHLTKGLDLLRYSRKPRYSTQPLKDAISQIFDKDATLNDVLHPICNPKISTCIE